MSHLDEGTLHALLDGELDLAEVSEIQLHLGSCVACGSRLQEVKQVLAEADRLVGAMETPAPAPRSRSEPRPESPRSPATPLREPRAPGIWDEAPVLLVPDPIDPAARRRRWLRGLSYAAVLAGVVAGGKLIGDALKPSHPILPERDLTSAAPAVPPPVASPEETRRPTTTMATRDRSARQPPSRSPAPAKSEKPEPVVDNAAADSFQELKDSTAGFLEDSIAGAQMLATGTATDSVADTTVVAQGAVRADADSAPPEREPASAGDSSRRDEELATRQAAAAALAELDRQRRRERANAATAALPRAQAPAAVESAPPPPRAPTLEDRSQIYLRIGLDEAVKQLGGPVHVIEGMTPQFIGLVRGQQVPGANPRRPVVRVVYLDPRGRLILLDQQRLDPGQAPGTPSGNLRWVIGDVMLYLRGEPSQDVLRSLQARVR